MAARSLESPQEAPPAAPAPGHQAAVDPPHDQGPPLRPLLGDSCSPQSVTPQLSRNAYAACRTLHLRVVHTARAPHHPSPFYRCTASKHCP